MLTGPASAADRSGAPPPDPRRTLTSLGVVVYDWDLLSDRITWGPNAAELFGLPDMSLLATGSRFAEVSDEGDGPTRGDAITACEASDEGTGVPYAAAYRVALGAERSFCVDDSGRWFADPDGRPARAHGTMRLRRGDVEAPPADRQGRAGFLSQVGHDIAEAAESGRGLTLFAIAVSNLASLNDELGFDAADRAVDHALSRLSATLRMRDRFMRYSGNRFALALRGCGQAEAESAARRILRLVTAEPIGTIVGPRPVELAIGGATAPDHALDAATLLRRAEAGLGLAKRRHGEPYLMYDPGLFRAAPRGPRREPLLESIDALNGRRIAFACQPIVRAGSRTVAFSEALLRIEAADGRVHPAGDVVPSLEAAGLIHLVDARMVELVVAHLARMPSARIALNVSPLSLDRPDWLQVLAGHLSGRPHIASRLILEVTETAAIRDPRAARQALEAVKGLGAAVAIDDFGAGHTSFRHLRDFPADFVKLDGAFVQNLTRSPDDRFFVRTLIDLARHLGIAIVAEWVEDEECARLLESWGVDYLQGDHCGRPELVVTADTASPPAAASLVA